MWCFRFWWLYCCGILQAELRNLWGLVKGEILKEKNYVDKN